MFDIKYEYGKWFYHSDVLPNFLLSFFYSMSLKIFQAQGIGVYMMSTQMILLVWLLIIKESLVSKSTM